MADPIPHTPGPWRVDGLEHYGKAFGVSATRPDGRRQPVINWRGIARGATPEGIANAHLTAGGPELLAFTRAAIALLDTGNPIADADRHRLAEQGRAALSRAIHLAS